MRQQRLRVRVADGRGNGTSNDTISVLFYRFSVLANGRPCRPALSEADISVGRGRVAAAFRMAGATDRGLNSLVFCAAAKKVV